jgi:hypothetical protein
MEDFCGGAAMKTFSVSIMVAEFSCSMELFPCVKPKNAYRNDTLRGYWLQKILGPEKLATALCTRFPKNVAKKRPHFYDAL